MANRNTVTDIDGKFTMRVTNTSASLIVSYIGFESQEIKIEGKTTIEVKLKSEEQTLKEVVVVGYGTAKKTDLTGAINSLTSAKITERKIPPIKGTTKFDFLGSFGFGRFSGII